MKLKPCPFCGTQPTTEEIAGITMVVCNDLDCSLSDRFSVSEWNSRPCEDKQKRKAKRRAERVITELRIELEMARQAWETWTYMPTKPCAHLRIRYDSSGLRCTDCGMVFSGCTTHVTCDAASTGDA